MKDGMIHRYQFHYDGCIRAAPFEAGLSKAIYAGEAGERLREFKISQGP